MKKVYKNISLSFVMLISFSGAFIYQGNNKVVKADIFTTPSSNGSSGGSYGGFYSWDISSLPLRLKWYTGSGGNKHLYIPKQMEYATGQGYHDLNRNLTGRWAYLGIPNITYTGGFSVINNTHYAVWNMIDYFKSRGWFSNGTYSRTLWGEYNTYIHQNGGYDKGDAYWKNGQRIDALSINYHNIRVSPRPKIDSVYTVEKLSGTSGNDFDNTNRGSQWNFYNPKGSSRYSGQSAKGQMNYNHKITEKVYLVQRTTNYKSYTYRSDQRNPNKRDVSSRTYSSRLVATHSNTFKYNVNSPEPRTYSFQPYNLNKSTGTGNGLMSSPSDTSLIRSYMGEYNGIDGAMQVTPNNCQNDTDGHNLKSIDTNTPTQFSLKWNNEQFGLPKDKLSLINGREPNGEWNYQDAVTGSWSANGDFNQNSTNIGGQKSNTQYYGATLSAGMRSLPISELRRRKPNSSTVST